MILYLQIEDYLAQWFINEMGGGTPVSLRRCSVESDVLAQFLSLPPEDYVPDTVKEGTLAINIPQFRHIDTRYRFFLPERARKLLVSLIRSRFDIQLWSAIHKFSSILSRQDESIYAFMERHGIEITEKNFNAIVKRYQRKRDIYRRSLARKKQKK